MNSKEIAEKINNKLTEHGYMRMCSDHILESIVSSLNLTVATPPAEGSVRVRIAVGYGPDAQGTPMVMATEIDGDCPEHEACANSFYDSDTHRAIVEAWIPPVAATPVVEGTVAK